MSFILVKFGTESILSTIRRFQPIQVPEPSVEETEQILQGLRERYEAHHKLTYTDEALMAAAKYSSQYISDRFLPDKAIDLIDEAGSRVRLRHAQLPEEARDLDKELRALLKEKDAAVRYWHTPWTTTGTELPKGIEFQVSESLL